MKIQEESKNNLTPYQVQLEKLFRKFIFLFDIYKKTINQKNIQIVFLIMLRQLKYYPLIK